MEKTNENSEKTLLLCTFCKAHLVDKKVEEIKQKFTIINNKVYALRLLSRHNSCVITYNVVKDGTNYKNKIRSTINLHRKKETNTLYTINALNALIKQCNNGVLDNNFKLDWAKYANKLILLENDNVVLLPTTLKKIFKW